MYKDYTEERCADPTGSSDIAHYGLTIMITIGYNAF